MLTEYQKNYLSPEASYEKPDRNGKVRADE